jgi:hypothetical protein
MTAASAPYFLERCLHDGFLSSTSRSARFGNSPWTAPVSTSIVIAGQRSAGAAAAADEHACGWCARDRTAAVSAAASPPARASVSGDCGVLKALNASGRVLQHLSPISITERGPRLTVKACRHRLRDLRNPSMIQHGRARPTHVPGHGFELALFQPYAWPGLCRTRGLRRSTERRR